MKVIENYWELVT